MWHGHGPVWAGVRWTRELYVRGHRVSVLVASAGVRWRGNTGGGAWGVAVPLAVRARSAGGTAWRPVLDVSALAWLVAGALLARVLGRALGGAAVGAHARHGGS